MKNWQPAEWAMIILAATVPISIMGIIIMRIFTMQPLSENASNVINNLMNIVGGGVIGIIATRLASKKTET